MRPWFALVLTAKDMFSHMEYASMDTTFQKRAHDAGKNVAYLDEYDELIELVSDLISIEVLREVLDKWDES